MALGALPDGFPAKLGAWDPVNGWTPVRYDNLYRSQSISGVQRFVIATEGEPVELLRKLVGLYSGPFRLVYLLMTPPEGYEPTRYEVAGLGLAEVDSFLVRFKPFLQADARHHIWIHAETSGGTLIYDEHDWIYAYGLRDEVERLLIQEGFQDGVPEIPFPHMHNESSAHDEAMLELLGAMSWKQVPVSNLG